MCGVYVCMCMCGVNVHIFTHFFTLSLHTTSSHYHTSHYHFTPPHTITSHHLTLSLHTTSHYHFTTPPHYHFTPPHTITPPHTVTSPYLLTPIPKSRPKLTHLDVSWKSLTCYYGDTTILLNSSPAIEHFSGCHNPWEKVVHSVSLQPVL